MSKMLEIVLDSGHEEFINKTMNKLIREGELQASGTNICLFDIIISYHDGNTSMFSSKLENGVVIDSMLYDEYDIKTEHEEGLSLVLKNKLHQLQPSLIVPELYLVKKLTVVERVLPDTPGVSIIVETNEGSKYGIAMRTTKSLINKTKGDR